MGVIRFLRSVIGLVLLPFVLFLFVVTELSRNLLGWLRGTMRRTYGDDPKPEASVRTSRQPRPPPAPARGST